MARIKIIECDLCHTRIENEDEAIVMTLEGAGIKAQGDVCSICVSAIESHMGELPTVKQRKRHLQAVVA